MIYELRIYDIHEGKMDAIQNRFKDHVIRMFGEHGMKITRFWVDADPKSNRLYYVVEHPDRETRDANYERFRDDPEWIELRKVTEADGPLVLKQESLFMKDVPYFTND